jgi:hypothetical protein
MASFRTHCKQCRKELGDDFGYVHSWLDEFMDGTFNHRAHRHHKEGIEEARKKWGDTAALAAKIHIEEDWGWVPEKSEYDSIDTMITKMLTERYGGSVKLMFEKANK